jgi:integrase
MAKYTRLAPRLYVYHGKRRDTYVTVTPEGKYVNIGHTRAEAEERLREQTVVEKGTIAAYFATFMTARKGTVAASTYKGNELEKENLCRIFGKFKPAHIRPMHVAQYMDKAIEMKRGGAANREKALLSALYQWLIRRGYAESNPCRSVSKNKSTFVKRRITDTELAEFLKFAREQSDTAALLADIAELSYLTAQRQSDILSLDRRQLKEEGIEFRQQKTGTEVLIEWTPRLRAVVDRCLARKTLITTTHVIRNSSGQRYSVQGFKAMWNRLQIAWEAAGNRRFRFHDLRAKATTKLLESGLRASDVTGHLSEAAVEQNYDSRVQRRGKAVE